MPNNLDQKTYLNQCLKLANESVKNGNHPFGALLVVDGHIVLSAQNEVVTKNDITAHAELRLVQEAQKVLTPEQLSQSTLYTSTEPCAMCAGAIYWAGIKKVVFACPTTELFNIVNEGLFLSTKEIYKKSTKPVSSIKNFNNIEFINIHKKFWKGE